MSFNSGTLVSDPVSRVRLLVGDIVPDYPILDDTTYEYLTLINTSELSAAIEALEIILNFYSLSPDTEELGGVKGSGISVNRLEKQLTKLKAKFTADKTGTGRVPMVLRSDRKDWSDFDNIWSK